MCFNGGLGGSAVQRRARDALGVNEGLSIVAAGTLMMLVKIISRTGFPGVA